MISPVINNSDYRQKQKRPFASSKSLHVVLRARSSVLRSQDNLKLVGDLLYFYSKRFHVKIYQNSVNTNHIHLVLFAKNKKSLQDFLRVFAGQVAQRITKSIKGKKLKISFWLGIVWSRVIEWGRAYLTALRYIYQNQLESLGLINYQQRKRKRAPRQKAKWAGDKRLEIIAKAQNLLPHVSNH